MFNIQSITEIVSISISVIAMLLANSTIRDKEKNRLRNIEQKMILEALLEKHEDKVSRDLNNIGAKINNIESELRLLEYKVNKGIEKNG